MTIRPGTNVLQRSAPAPLGIPVNTGRWFAVGVTERGPVNVPTLIHNMTEYYAFFGNRIAAGALLWDSLDVFFREGGLEAVVTRTTGPNPVKGTHTYNDAGAAASIAIDEIGPFGTTSAAIVAGAVSGFAIQVFDTSISSTVPVETSYDLATPTDAVNWAAGLPDGTAASKYVRVRALGANVPVNVAIVALAGAVTDNANVTDTQRIASLALIPTNWGPGNVSVPGVTTTGIHTALVQHAQGYSLNGVNRFALCDLVDTATVSTLTTELDSQRSAANEDESFGMCIAGWPIVPGIVANTTRTVPPCALVAALMAQGDNQFGSPNVPMAGINGISSFSLGVSQTWTDAQRQTLNDKGVNVIRSMFGTVRLYGYRTMVDPVQNSDWLNAANARLRMAITAQALAIAEAFQFAQLDGKGRKVAEFGGQLSGMLGGFYVLGSLFGDTADEAYRVNVGSTVNTPATLANNELHAVLELRMSPMAEMTVIEIVHRSILQAI